MSKKILIVEDEPNILIPLRFLMEQNGFAVKTVEDGESVRPEMEDFAPDLMLLDIMLPRMDGLEVCQMIRHDPRWKDTKIIILSAKGGEVDVVKGMTLGADAYITKPFSNAEVVRCVLELLGCGPPPGRPDLPESGADAGDG